MAAVENRNFDRHGIAHQGAILWRDLRIPVDFADISRGGCKMRLQGAILDLLKQAVPLEVTLVCGETELAATLLWESGGLLGAQFAHQLSIDEVAALLAGRARFKG